MKRIAEADDPRRRLLIEALAAGLFSVGLPRGNALAADILGGRPAKLSAGQSIYRVSGTATVNDSQATRETRIRSGDTVGTGKDSEIVFVCGESAMILRGDSQVVLEANKNGTTSMWVAGLRLLKGRLLSVYPKGPPVQIRTATATVEVRGTGVYLEADPEQTYFCTCYGIAAVSANDDPDSKDTVTATHHDKPLYILAGSKNRGNSIRKAPFVNHTDQELALIETLVGRTTPFVVLPDTKYSPGSITYPD